MIKLRVVVSLLLVSMVLQGCVSKMETCCAQTVCAELIEAPFVHVGVLAAVDLARARAEDGVIDLDEYEMTDIFYSVMKGQWTVFFEVKEEFRREAVGNVFSASVDAFTGQVEIHPGY